MRRAFTLIELLVVIGIVAIIMSLLMPTLAKSQRVARRIQCLSNLRSVGQAMLIYSQSNGGQMFPADAGGAYAFALPSEEWYVHVFPSLPKPPPQEMSVWAWEYSFLRCPADLLDPSSGNAHSYALNDHINERRVKFSTRLPGGLTPSAVVLVGEKMTFIRDWYVQALPPGDVSDYDKVVEPFRHGRTGSNYLFLDIHVETLPPIRVRRHDLQLDPWDLGAGSPEGRTVLIAPQ